MTQNSDSFDANLSSIVHGTKGFSIHPAGNHPVDSREADSATLQTIHRLKWFINDADLGQIHILGHANPAIITGIKLNARSCDSLAKRFGDEWSKLTAGLEPNDGHLVIPASRINRLIDLVPHRSPEGPPSTEPMRFESIVDSFTTHADRANVSDMPNGTGTRGGRG